MHHKFTAAAIATAAAATLGIATTAYADADYHTVHADLHVVGEDPLASGFVNNIHMEGPVAYAREYYQLRGAVPNTSYVAVIELHLGDPSCGPDSPMVDLGGEFPGIISAVLETNRAGNAHAASVLFSPEDVAGLTGAEHGVNWVFYNAEGERAFESGCSADYLD